MRSPIAAGLSRIESHITIHVANRLDCGSSSRWPVCDTHGTLSRCWLALLTAGRVVRSASLAAAALRWLQHHRRARGLSSGIAAHTTAAFLAPCQAATEAAAAARGVPAKPLPVIPSRSPAAPAQHRGCTQTPTRCSKLLHSCSTDVMDCSTGAGVRQWLPSSHSAARGPAGDSGGWRSWSKSRRTAPGACSSGGGAVP